MYKKIIAAILCIVTVASLVACGSKQEPTNTESIITQPTETAPVETKPKNVLTEYPMDKSEYIAQLFLNSLLNKDFETAKECLNVPAETPFFTAQDVEWYLERSAYKKICEIGFEEYDIVRKETTITVNNQLIMLIKDKNSELEYEFTIWVDQDENNQWKIRDDSFYLEEYYILAPGGNVEITIDGLDISNNMIGTNDTYGHRNLYKLTYVGKSEKEYVAISENYDNYTVAVCAEKNTNEKPYELQVLYKDDDVLEVIKNSWIDHHNKTSDSNVDVDKYFSENITEIDKDIVMNGVLSMYNNSCSGIQLKNIEHSTGVEYQSRWISDRHVLVYFNYSTSWVVKTGYSKTQTKNMDYYSQLVLVKNDDDTWQIDSIKDGEGFYSTREGTIQKSR